MVERQNRTVQACLVKTLENEQKEWRKALPGIIFAINNSKQASTKFTPFFLMHGWHPRSVVDIVTTDSSPINLSELEPAEFDTCVHNHVERLKRVHCEVFQEAHQNIKNAQKRQKTDYDNRHKTKKVYSVGEKVLLYNLRRADRKGGKQCDIWNGPYSVTEVHDNGTYTLSNSKGPMKQKAHAVNLKPFHSSNDPVPSDSQGPAFTWTPVSESWKTEKSEVCGLKWCRGLNFCKNRSSDESHPTPLRTKRTKGDGNCFFCTLASVIIYWQ